MIGFYLVALGFCVALLYYLGRRFWAQHRKPRGERHDLKVVAFTSWLMDPDIVKVARKAGMSQEGLERYRAMIGTLDEPEVDIVITKFLKPRLVRRAVAKHLQKQGGTSHSAALKRLYAFVKAIEAKYESA